MELKLLNKEELTGLYQNEMTVDFPKSELKPLSAMLLLMDTGRYEPLLVADGGRPVGYAIVWLPENREGALLEYFGVLRGLRNGGLGSKILGLLAERYGQVFGEAEAPDSDDPAENDLRRRRIAFYERNGFRVLDYECALFGVRFKCLYRGPEGDDRKVQIMHRGVYASHFSPAHMERYIQLPLAPGETVKPAPAWMEETPVALLEYDSSRETETIRLIQGFWLAHNQYRQTEEEARADLRAWTGEGHRLYLILLGKLTVGLLHLGSRGAEIDWLEDLFVLPEYQGWGIGTEAVQLAEAMVRQYSASMYIEAAARNERAIRLYRRLGYDCLNTITVRKDFPGYQYDVVREEQVYGERFEIRKDKEG